MESISRFVFIPVMLCLLIASFHEKTRKRMLSLGAVASAEEGLASLSRLYWPAFFLILAAGIFTRCWQFGILPLGLNQDGTMAGIEASCLLTNGTDQYGISWPTYFKAWGFSQMSTLYSYLLIPFVKGMGLTRISLRLPMLLVSVGSLVVIWDFARRIAGRGFALAALFVAATNPWHILQSRWALEANLMPHVLLMAVYLLYIGRTNRPALYASMVFFGLAPYAYGVACFSMPFIVLGAAVYYVWRKRVKWFDVAACVLIFLAIAGPYFYTMAINAFGLQTVHLGPFTLPRFADSMRARDISVMQEYPYMAMVWNLYAHLTTWLFDNNYAGECYSALDWTHTMYLFMPAVCLCGAYLADVLRGQRLAGLPVPLQNVICSARNRLPVDTAVKITRYPQCQFKISAFYQGDDDPF
ncbi:MAG: glycosyltransferase family 39 protein [Clostridia bacterium]|nr:glycosyltransferase family 39 protein [Clostridia bacterium]